ncbi:MAG: hypothetical protein F4087_10245 [Gemmatimonadetes bacterium]|nr:hypothetical protein [Gemmatimonadota bacterium]MYA12754.1 hypothetical protein [Gemmatimonadota bacterium]MYE71272.1 hypothetical protein [Gemmatimonadota bacterium]MYJ68872.1 hypothetical protein [Gemmatimonadota bacterium]
MMRSTVAAIFALPCAAVACLDAPPAPITAVDSAGVEIVRIPDLQTLDLPEIELRLLHSTASIPDLVFSHVIGAVFQTDTSLAIADDRSHEIVFLDPGGSLRARSGGEGRGPGEYTSIGRIGIGVDGVPFVFDSRQRRFTFLEPGWIRGHHALHRPRATRAHRHDRFPGPHAVLRVGTGRPNPWRRCAGGGHGRREENLDSRLPEHVRGGGPVELAPET